MRQRDTRPLLRRIVGRDQIRFHLRRYLTRRQRRRVGEKAIQHHRQPTGRRPQHDTGHPQQIETTDFAQYVEAIIRVGLIDGDSPPHHLHLVANLRQRQIGANPDHLLRIAAGQDADDRCRRRGIGHPQFADAKQGNALLGQRAGVAHHLQQQLLPLLTAHRRTAGNIAAAPRHPHIHHAGQRFAIDTDINYMHFRPGLGGEHADAGGAAGHICRLDGGDRLRRNRHPFVPHSMVGAHHQQGLFRHLRLAAQAGHSRQLHRQRLQTPEAAGGLE
ncbi:Uncharacterised protein [Klebsiella pneumoniae]|nr:Uncharacterised protein [Klebsiella pneumoniae]